MKKIYVSALLIFLLCACKKDEKITGKDPCVCYGETECTDIYKSITIELKNQNNQPIRLDQYYTVSVATGEKFSFQHPEADSIGRSLGKYIIFADKFIQSTEKCGKDFEFTGLRNGVEIVRKTFKIGHDCCHVRIVTGNPEIIIPE